MAIEETQQKEPLKIFTNHGLVLLFIAKKQDATIREISRAVNITERRVMEIVRDLQTDKYLEAERQGRRNFYTPFMDTDLLRNGSTKVSLGDVLKNVQEV